VLMNRPNLNPCRLLDRGKDGYIAKRTHGGFEEVIGEMESLAQRLSLSRGWAEWRLEAGSNRG
jgi:hypothetical protein